VNVSSLITATGPGANKADAGVGLQFKFLSLRVTSAAPDTVTQLQTSPDNSAWTTVDTVTGSGWGWASRSARGRYARANCTVLGTGGAPYSAVVTGNPA
jgi:hypothetical protein